MAVKNNFMFEDLEVNFLLEILYQKYQVDFREYKRAYILRRIYSFMSHEKLPTITSLTDKVMQDDDFGTQIIKKIIINVTEMFRTPQFYKSLRETVVPILSTYPNIRVWIAGCSTGEEVLSVAILLKECGVYNRTKILASDFDEKSLKLAKSLIYPKNDIKKWTENYFLAGGVKSFSDYYNVRYDQAIFDSDLLENVQFEEHDLTSAEYPNHFHLILCRNVLIYFKNNLQNHVVQQFINSLNREGFIGLGSKETIRDSIQKLEVFDKTNKIYRHKDE